jgi:hypothetical protein
MKPYDQAFFVYSNLKARVEVDEGPPKSWPITLRISGSDSDKPELIFFMNYDRWDNFVDEVTKADKKVAEFKQTNKIGEGSEE